jgi:hypothetical protein
MIGLLSFVLECAAVAASIAVLSSVAIAVLWLLLDRVLALGSPTARAETAFSFAIVPALLSIGATGAAALPPITAVLGWTKDHCSHHLHHLHLCLIHSPGLRPALAAVGAFSIAVFVVRVAVLVHGQLQMKRTIDGLVGLASTTGTLLEIPGEPRLCHAIGFFRGRILLSQSMRSRLDPEQLRSALAHETAHLRRRDPLANLVLSLAGVFHVPGVSTMFSRAYRHAAEEACDDHAASIVGDRSVVAGALVSVAALQRGLSLGWSVPAFGELLEGRVRRLLDGDCQRSRPSHALAIGAVMTAVVLGAALDESATLHHAVETLLHHVF